MKLSFAILTIPLLLMLNSCWIQDAPTNMKREVHIVSDYLTEADSSLIRNFEKTYKAKAVIVVIPADSIFARFRDQKYNSGIDVLITENEAIRNRLKSAGGLQKLSNTKLFSKTDRQFYESHQLWVGISHDPLVLVKTTDSSGYCKSVNWSSWHVKDSMRANVKIKDGMGNYFNQLSADFPQLMDKKLMPATGETIYPLSRIVSFYISKDTLSPLPANPCFYYLVRNKRYISSLTSASVMRYSPNARMAETFVNYLHANSWAVASSRNHLAVNKEVRPNWHIANLKIR